MKHISLIFLMLAAGCHYAAKSDSLSLIQIQDRNGVTETISNPDRLVQYLATDFLSSQPYKKVLRVYKGEGKSRSQITTYHPNGMICQYLEAEEMRAHGLYREWFENGQMKVEAHVVGGTADIASGTQEDWIFDQICRVWDEQGNLVAQIPYEKGVLEGKSIYFFPTGQIEKEIPYKKNKIDGEAIEYFPDGTLKSKTRYARGLREGDSIGFFENGAKAWVEDHSDDRLKKGSYFSPKGELISEVDGGGGFVARYDAEGVTIVEYRVGLPHGWVRKYNLNNELKRAFFIKNGMKHGEEFEYFLPSEAEESAPKPATKLSIQWNENRIHGCVKTWYSNGQMQSQREYCRNQKMGPSLAWYRDGSLMLYEEYEEDRLVTGQYYKLQRKEPISSVANGNGIATLFDEMGAFIRKVNYFKGKPLDPEE